MKIGQIFRETMKEMGFKVEEDYCKIADSIDPVLINREIPDELVPQVKKFLIAEARKRDLSGDGARICKRVLEKN